MCNFAEMKLYYTLRIQKCTARIRKDRLSEMRRGSELHQGKSELHFFIDYYYENVTVISLIVN